MPAVASPSDGWGRGRTKQARRGSVSLVGLVNLAERLFNQTQSHPNEDTGLTTKAPNAISAQTTQAKLSEEFRPSGGNAASEAGLFQVSQASAFTTAARRLRPRRQQIRRQHGHPQRLQVARQPAPRRFRPNCKV